MRIAEILTEEELAELLNLPTPIKQQRNRTFIVQPDAVKSAQRVKKLKTNIAVADATQPPSEIEMVKAMWQARDLQKLANKKQTATKQIASSVTNNKQ